MDYNWQKHLIGFVEMLNYKFLIFSITVLYVLFIFITKLIVVEHIN